MEGRHTAQASSITTPHMVPNESSYMYPSAPSRTPSVTIPARISIDNSYMYPSIPPSMLSRGLPAEDKDEDDADDDFDLNHEDILRLLNIKQPIKPCKHFVF